VRSPVVRIYNLSRSEARGGPADHADISRNVRFCVEFEVGVEGVRAGRQARPCDP
jgi:hypothetical protein